MRIDFHTFEELWLAYPCDVERVVLAYEAGLTIHDNDGEPLFLGEERDWIEYDRLLDDSHHELLKIFTALGIEAYNEKAILFNNKQIFNKLLKEDYVFPNQKED